MPPHSVYSLLFLLSLLFQWPGGMHGQTVDSTQAYFQKGEAFLGTDAFRVDWQGLVRPGEPLADAYRLGLRGGFYLQDGWAVGAGWTEAYEAASPPSQPATLRWSIVSVFTRYVLRLHPKWSPFAELAWSYAAAFHSDPNLRTGAGAAVMPRLGLAFRLNEVWSAEAGLMGLLPLDTDSGYAYLRDNSATFILKGGLNLHFGRRAIHRK